MTLPPSQQPRQVAISTRVDWQSGMVIFSETAQNGLAIVNPPTVTVPLILLMRIASEAIHQSLPPQLQQMNLTPPPQQEPPNDRGGRSLAFDANIGNPKS